MAAAMRAGEEPMLSNAAFALQDLKAEPDAAMAVAKLLEELAAGHLTDVSRGMVETLLE